MIDKTVANSSGYFADPATKQLLTGLEERVIKCAIDESGKLIWPQVRFSDGTQGKIVYRLWTNEEKEIYKQYRSGSKPKEQASAPAKEEKSYEYNNKVVSSEGSVAAQSTLDFIRLATEYHGVWLFDGVMYDMLAVRDDRGKIVNRPVPRSVMPLEALQRFGIL